MTRVVVPSGGVGGTVGGVTGGNVLGMTGVTGVLIGVSSVVSGEFLTCSLYPGLSMCGVSGKFPGSSSIGVRNISLCWTGGVCRVRVFRFRRIPGVIAGLVVVGVAGGVAVCATSTVSVGVVGGVAVGLAGIWIVSIGHSSYNGENFLRNVLFLLLILPDPSILMKYWSFCCTSITIPVLSHFSGN